MGERVGGSVDRQTERQIDRQDFCVVLLLL